MAAGNSLDELLDAMPDEFGAQAKQTKTQLKTQFAHIIWKHIRPTFQKAFKTDE